MGIVIPLVVVLYIRTKREEEDYYKKKYKNVYLDEYLETNNEVVDEDTYRMLVQANELHKENEAELKQEMQQVASLFYARMVSSGTWSTLKNIKEELEFRKVLIDSETRRFEKEGRLPDIQKREKTQKTQDKAKDKTQKSQRDGPQDSYAEDLRKALYRKIMECKSDK